MPKLITHLALNQVFVFGSNQDGFHGAGAAGYACRGTVANTWRDDPWFLAAMRAPVGSPARVGKWAIYGVGRGWQQGREGMSYAIQTIERPGARRSTPLSEIEKQLVQLVRFAKDHSQWEFLMTPIGAGLSGWTNEEMEHCLQRALKETGGKPDNLVVPPNLYQDVSWKAT